jgi:hypothetical protein
VLRGRGRALAAGLQRHGQAEQTASAERAPLPHPPRLPLLSYRRHVRSPTDLEMRRFSNKKLSTLHGTVFNQKGAF